MLVKLLPSIISIYLLVLSMVLDRVLKLRIDDCFEEEMSQVLFLVAKGWESNVTIFNTGMGFLVSVYLILSPIVQHEYLASILVIGFLIFLGMSIYIFAAREPSWSASMLVTDSFLWLEISITRAGLGKLVLLMAHIVLVCYVVFVGWASAAL